MKVRSNGRLVDSDNEETGFIYTPGTSPNNVGIRVHNRLTIIPYNEFIQMANEIIRKKEEHDARTT